MWIDEHPYLFLYLVGCVLALVLIVLGFIISGLVGWVTKQNIANKNLRKLLPPQTFAVRASTFLWTLVFSAALSWLSVLTVLLWEIPSALLRLLRVVFSSTPPEAIKLLQFPLKNNPYMSREAVWAYTQALQIRLGQAEPREAVLFDSLDELLGYYPTFDRMAALKDLRALNVLNPEIVSAVLDRVSKSAQEEEEEEEEDFFSDTVDSCGPQKK